MAQCLAGKVCLVTGASRGIGKGIALQLGEAGATVYITGRTLYASKDAEVIGSLAETAKEIESRGGKCIPVQCDHTKDDNIEHLFDKIAKEQNGHLDVLVNNAYSGVKAIADYLGKPFWQQPSSVWDDINNVGLRMMVLKKRGLIVNISSAGGLTYTFSVSYGVGKAACDRLAADCACELKKHNVAAVSLWPGFVFTENLHQLLEKNIHDNPFANKLAEHVRAGETPEYSGRCVVHLASDPKIMEKTGRVLISSDLGDQYGFVDINGKKPLCIRSLKFIIQYMWDWNWLANWIPSFIKVPTWMLNMSGNKF